MNDNSPMLSPELELAMELIRCKSVSPRDEGCQQILARRLSNLGFSIETLPFGEVDNFWATRGPGNPSLVFAGHTDVVPAGALADWDTDPFQPAIRQGYLYGRGAADMKGSLASFICALEKFLLDHSQHQGTIGVLITSDEEADAINGTVKVMDTLLARGTKFDMCVVGEPSSSRIPGDIIRVGRRGSLNARLIVHGTQGHVAYADEADNPIHRIADLISALTNTHWDDGDAQFPPTSFQISNIHSGTGATNVIPGKLEMLFNFRFGTQSTAEGLKKRVQALLEAQRLDYDLSWTLSGEPFITNDGKLIPAAQRVIRKVMGIEPQLSTSGGTSDGRFIAPAGIEVIELGPCNLTIHKVNERVAVHELEQLTNIYLELLNELVA